MLPETLILSSLFCYSKKRLFEEIAENASVILEVPSDFLIKELNKREQYGATVFYNGIAMPHAVIPGISKTIAVLSILDSPVHFNSIDSDPLYIDIAYTLFISPNDEYEEISKLLKNITEVFSNQDLLNSMRIARNERNKISTLLKQIEASLENKVVPS